MKIQLPLLLKMNVIEYSGFFFLNVEVNKPISELYDNLTLTKTWIQNIIQYVVTLWSSGAIDILEKCCGLAHVKKSLLVLKNMFKLLRNPFHHLDTEHKRFQYFMNTKFLINPIEHKLGRREVRSQTHNSVSLNLKDRALSYIPLRQSQIIFRITRCPYRPVHLRNSP